MKRAVAVLLVVAFTSSGCATMLRRQERGSARASIAVVVQHADPTILVDGRERAKTLVYDGARHGSSYYVYRVFPDGRPDRARITVRAAGGAVIGEGETRRHSEGLSWFLVSGLWILIDWPLGALAYYDDVRIAARPAPPSPPAGPPAAEPPPAEPPPAEPSGAERPAAEPPAAEPPAAGSATESSAM
ncbi:MAG TPA: hypothetical protein VM734_15555 [Kofleriaceae bacterium]|nr:hypothetical protein [Kofleriaceae bacterium]